jgi:hypothetical protein
VKKGVFFFLTGLLGIVFVASAVFKFTSLELFELDLVDTGFVGFWIAPYAARSIIALELFLGLLLLFRIWLKEFAYPGTLILVLIFTAYLIIELTTKGNSGSCNCFGTILILSPVGSIIKNTILILFTVILWRFDKPVERKFEKWLLVFFSLTAFSFPYVANPVTIYESTQGPEDNQKHKLNLDVLYADTNAVKPSIDLRKGRHILACVTLKCPHCILETYKLHLIRNKNPEVSIYLFLNGKIKDLQGFLKQTKTENLPHLMVPGKKFIALTGYRVPTIFFLENGIIIRKVNYLQLDQEEIYKWVDQNRTDDSIR